MTVWNSRIRLGQIKIKSRVQQEYQPSLVVGMSFTQHRSSRRHRLVGTKSHRAAASYSAMMSHCGSISISRSSQQASSSRRWHLAKRRRDAVMYDAGNDVGAVATGSELLQNWCVLPNCPPPLQRYRPDGIRAASRNVPAHTSKLHIHRYIALHPNFSQSPIPIGSTAVHSKQLYDYTHDLEVTCRSTYLWQQFYKVPRWARQ